MNESKELAAKLAAEVLDNYALYNRRVLSLFGAEQGIQKVIIPEIREATGIELEKTGDAKPVPDHYTGERRNLQRLLAGDNNWADTLYKVHSFYAQGMKGIIKPGDYLEIPLHIEATTIDGVEFGEIDLDKTELTVVHVDGGIVFNFEDVISFGAMNPKNTNAGGFKKSTMAKYLNGPFLQVFDEVKKYMLETEEGLKITLPTEFEVFGTNDDAGCNWPDENGAQFSYFKKIKNRIKVQDNDTKWWWLSTASGATTFCNVDYHGNATYHIASYAGGGVAPAFCIS
jgi:hypothetical protein